MEEGCTLARVSGAISPSCWGGMCVASAWQWSTNPGLYTSSRTRGQKGNQKQSKAIPSRSTPVVCSKERQGLRNFPHSITMGDRVLKPRSHGGHFTVGHNTRQNSSFSELLLSDTDVATGSAYEQCLYCTCFPIPLLSTWLHIHHSSFCTAQTCSICICALTHLTTHLSSSLYSLLLGELFLNIPTDGLVSNKPLCFTLSRAASVLAMRNFSSPHLLPS